MALVGGGVLAFLYLVALFAPFIAPYDPQFMSKYSHLPPQGIHFLDSDGFSCPSIYGLDKERDPDTYQMYYVEIPEDKYCLRLFVHGNEYKLFGFLPMDIHLFGVEGDHGVFLWGTDRLGRDLFSRCIWASQVSLSIGLLGVILSFVLGIILGGISGYYGGVLDSVIQQVIIFLTSLPTLPLWMGLSAAVPGDWPPLRVYFGITVVLSLMGWTGLARVIRGMILELKEEDFVIASRLAGSRDHIIIFSHILPSCMSYLIVRITLAVPGMIIGETALSYLGLGLRDPAVSWGVLLENAQSLRALVLHPWLLIPILFVIVTSLAFNFLGDGLRDAADPYSEM